MKGKVIFYHQIKGYGFIKSEDDQEIFFHISELEDYNPPQINVNQEVEFGIVRSNKGDKANKIKKIGKEVKGGKRKQNK